MKNDSKQAKGRYLQNLVKDRIVRLYPVLTKKDIRTSMRSENGADVKLLTQTARKLFPYSIETKNRQVPNLHLGVDLLFFLILEEIIL